MSEQKERQWQHEASPLICRDIWFKGVTYCNYNYSEYLFNYKCPVAEAPTSMSDCVHRSVASWGQCSAWVVCNGSAVFSQTQTMRRRSECSSAPSASCLALLFFGSLTVYKSSALGKKFDLLLSLFTQPFSERPYPMAQGDKSALSAESWDLWVWNKTLFLLMSQSATQSLAFT